MNIANILLLKFPNIIFMRDVIIQDDGTGPYIKEWHLEGVARPSQEDLDKWETELTPQFEQLQKMQQLADLNASTISKLEILDAKSIRALRTNDKTRLAELEAQAAILRQQLITSLPE